MTNSVESTTDTCKKWSSKETTKSACE
jgi:hypothetical protein